ncbi:MAG TPA: ABC transporter ATP-binding protein [Bacilli bacterium]
MKTIKNNVAILKYVYKFCPLMIIFALFYIVSTNILAISKINIIAKAIDLVTRGEDIKILLLALCEYLIIILITSIFTILFNNYIRPRNRTLYIKNMQQFLFAKVKYIDMESFDNPEFYDNYSRALREGTYRGIQVFEELVHFIAAITTTITIGIKIVVSDYLLIAIILISSIVNIVVINIINKRWYYWSKETEQDRRMYQYINRTFYRQRFAGEIKTTPISDLLIKKYRNTAQEINQKYAKTHLKLIKFHTIFHISKVFIEYGASTLYLGYRLFKATNKISISTFTASLNAVSQFSSYFTDAINFLTRLKEYALYIDDFLWLINYEPELEKNEGKSIDEINDLNLVNVSFKYPEALNFSLENININIKKGEKIALVGPNGSGKTTLIKLLLRFYNPTDGKILANNLNYNDLMISSLRNNYAVVFQDFQIYAMTIGENILMRKLETNEDEERVWDALEKVGMKDKIMMLPEGINTEVTREFNRQGAVFSGGEIQRLAIARVFASDASLYILDEPTSSLDPLSEEKINKLIIKNAEKTMIIIAHRLSTVVDADWIYLIDKGRVVEEGTHEELLRQNGMYAKMFLTQKSLYLER